MPSEVLTPASPEEVARELARANQAGLAVTPWGGGTQMGLGNPPRRFDLALRTTRLDQILEHSPEDLTATVQAGITLMAVQDALAKQGQHVALEAPLPDQATIGGILAAGGDGPRRFSYGNPREQVIGIRVAHPDGTLTKAGGKVVKNVTGYEMTKLYTGSLGTLGVIVEVSLKLWPLPAVTETVVARCPSLEGAVSLVPRLLAAGLQPLAVDTLNGDPWGPPDYWLLALEFGGSRAAVDRKLREARVLFSEAGFQETPAPDQFWRAVRDFSRTPVSRGLVVRAAALPTQLAALALECEGATIVARAGNGILHAFWPPEALGRREPAAWGSIVERIREVSNKLGGSTVVEDCPPHLKNAIDIWGPPPSGFPVMKRLKEQFDPKGVLNPGRFIGGL